MNKRILGQSGPSVYVIGLGCMGMSGMYGPADRTESIATIHAALDAGVTLLDTGDFYGMGHNEMLLAEALKGVPRDNYQLSVKFGNLRGPDRAIIGNDSRPKSIRNFLAYSLQRLGVDYLDIYRPSRLDTEVPIEETIGALADLVKEGFIRHIGLSEIGATTLRRAAAVHPICDLQIEYSLISRGIETEILPAARELGIGITAYGVLARGLMSGHWRKEAAASTDIRTHTPRFAEANIDANLKLVEALRTLAEARGVSVAQVAIAWVLHQGDDIFPIVGSRKRVQLAEALGALDIALSLDELASIELAVPADAAAGGRYPDAALKAMDSEAKAT
jgi:aryl-alcohol dehydrogenase-like predicted oxidoreductase